MNPIQDLFPNKIQYSNFVQILVSKCNNMVRALESEDTQENRDKVEDFCQFIIMNKDIVKHQPIIKLINTFINESTRYSKDLHSCGKYGLSTLVAERRNQLLECFSN